MIKVIRPRTRRNVECANCGALLSYEEEDVREGSDKEFIQCTMSINHIPYNYIICPECGETIRLAVIR